MSSAMPAISAASHASSSVSHGAEIVILEKISPVNISVHTTDPELRCRMMHNRFAGESLKYMYRLAEAGVDLNTQIVLCRNWNDGEALHRTLDDLASLHPAAFS